MADISAAQVKELRERTGAGFMDCKRALTEADGDIDKAIALLRERAAAGDGYQTAEALRDLFSALPPRVALYDDRARWPQKRPIRQQGRVPLPRRASRATRQCRCPPHAKLASHRRATLRREAEGQYRVVLATAQRSRRPSLPSLLFSHLLRHHFSRKGVHADAPLAQHDDSVMAVEHSAVWPRLQRSGPTQPQGLDKLDRR